MSAEPRRFECTPGGAFLAGRRRLARWLLGGALALLVLTVWLWLDAQWVPGILALGSSLACWTAWRLSGDADLLWIEVDGEAVVAQLRNSRVSLHRPLTARRLQDDERAHVLSLATTAGVLSGATGFDSSRLGEIELHLTDLSKAVLLQDDERRMILTPDDVEGFLSAVGASGDATL